MIPPQAWAKSLNVVFGMIAARRGPHWKLAQLPAEQNPFGNGTLDEALTLGESLAAVMAHVPLPTKELGIVNDLATAGFAFYYAINMRLQMDAQLQAAHARAATGARVAQPASDHGAVTAGRNGGEVTAADLLAAMPTEPLVQTGDPIADGVQLGHAPTSLLASDEDPEPVLLEAFRPGEAAVPIDVLAAGGDGNVLDRLAPPIEVEGQPAARELGDPQGG